MKMVDMESVSKNCVMRERVIQSIKHSQPDITPWHIELTTGFANELKQQTGCGDVEDYLGNHLMRLKYKQNTKINDSEELDIFGVRWGQSVDGGDVGIVVDTPMKEADFRGYQFPEIRRDFALELCSAMADEPRGVFRMFSITMCFFERAWSLRGMENILMDMCMNETFVAELFEHILNHHLELLDLVLDHEFEGVYFGDDWGQQKGLIMGPPMWRKYIKPAMAKMFEKVKGKGKYVILHSCGDLRDIMPELIDIGVDVYNTVQPEIYDLKELKRQYGRHISFYGGISTQQFLPTATVQQSREMAAFMLESMGKDGGYILSPTHAVTPDIPVDNVLAMLDVARQAKWN